MRWTLARFHNPWQRVVQQGKQMLPAQWVTALIGVLLTLAISATLVKGSGVYESEAYVVFLPPRSGGTNPLLPQSSLIPTALVVAGAVNAGNDAPSPALDDIPLTSTGVKHGYLATVPNSGSQWVPLYRQAEVHVQATGTSEEEAQQRLQVALDRLNDVLTSLQSRAGSPSKLMIRAQLSPSLPDTYYVQGDRMRSAGSSLLVGLALTAFAIRLVRRLTLLWRWRTFRSRLRWRPDPAPTHTAPTHG